jgi:hypothetical protein
MEIVSRAEAKKKGVNLYFTGKPCINGHTSERYTTNGTCFTCANKNHVNLEKVKLWTKSNPEKCSKINKMYRDKNIEKLLKKSGDTEKVIQIRLGK